MKVNLMMAQSADGIIARDQHHFPDWTCSADKRLFKKVTQRAGAVIMGSKTYAAIGRPLAQRRNVIYTRHPERFEPHEGVHFTALDPKLLLEQLAAEGFEEVALAGGSQINSLFAAQGLIDELLLTISPLVFGQGLTLFAGPLDLKLRLLETRLLDEHTVHLRYRIIKS